MKSPGTSQYVEEFEVNRLVRAGRGVGKGASPEIGTPQYIVRKPLRDRSLINKNSILL